MSSVLPKNIEEAATFDLAQAELRELNATLQALPADTNQTSWAVLNPRGAHALAVGLTAPVTVTIQGHAGYYCAGMNDGAAVVVDGNVGTGVAENMMSGTVHVKGDASQSAGATAHGGLLIIEGNASARCGISMKGLDIVVKGNVGHMSAFMAQSGNLVVCGDAGEALGDSLYEARIFVKGKVASLGADCEKKEMTAEDKDILSALLQKAGIETKPEAFTRYGSARKLYHFHVDNAGAY
ncbi:protein glxC [Acidocella sp.]|uniref:GltB/FmdC/FwdC-like GXGXG domain-containing protein n=1 Tax=Acidocella sp. TaxID=50710 RepID=UPI003D058484